MYKRLTYLAICLLVLTSCGFRPLYDGRGGTNEALADLATIEIAQIPDRVGQMMRNELSALLQPKGLRGDTRYRLEIKINESVKHLGIQKDTTATRANLVLAVRYVLKSTESGGVVFSDTTTMQMSYNILTAVYATKEAEATARRRGVAEIAKNIRSQLAVYFTRKARESAAR